MSRVEFEKKLKAKSTATKITINVMIIDFMAETGFWSCVLKGYGKS